MIAAEILELAKYGVAIATGAAGVWWSQLQRAKAEGTAQGVSAAELRAVADRVHALEAQHAELMRHVNERATKADVQAMERNIIAQMDSRFANLIALMTRVPQ
jgi:hypothetical protein